MTVTGQMNALTAHQSVLQMYNALQVLSLMDPTAPWCPKHTVIHDADNFECDFIIIGAGAAGCVVANRLTENPKNKVCVVEAGGNPPLETAFPGWFAFVKRPENMWNYKYEVDSNNPTFHEEKVGFLALGKMLSGSSGIDNYVHERGDPEDYDEWAKLVKDPSWNYQQALRLFIKSENLDDAEINNSPYKKYHGTSGYMGITKQYCERTDKYIEAFKDIGHKELIDFNGREVTGYGRVFLHAANNTHQTGNFAYFTPIIGRTNLKVIKHSTVVKIRINDNKKAEGVFFINENKKEVYLKARKEVIVAAGAINTPKLLMLSGIGPSKHLKEKNIPCLIDLPVGRNLIDHACVPILHKTEKITQPQENLGLYKFPEPLVLGRVGLNSKRTQYRIISYVLHPTNMLKYCLACLGFAKDVSQYFYDQSEGREIVFSVLAQQRPKSRGSVELRSANYQDSPIVKSGLMSDPYDVNRTIEYMKDFRRIRNSCYFNRVNASELIYSRCLHLDVNSDDYLKCGAKGMSHSPGDPIGTCAMGSVVDSRLRVIGAKSLRVVDSSVVPVPISGGMYATTVMVAERAVEILREENNC